MIYVLPFSFILPHLQALERFSQEAPLPSDDDNKENESIYDKKVEDLEKFLDAPLHVIYLKQLSILREKSLKTFKQALTSEGTEFEAMMQADEFYRKVIPSNFKSRIDCELNLLFPGGGGRHTPESRVVVRQRGARVERSSVGNC